MKGKNFLHIPNISFVHDRCGIRLWCYTYATNLCMLLILPLDLNIHFISNDVRVKLLNQKCLLRMDNFFLCTNHLPFFICNLTIKLLSFIKRKTNEEHIFSSLIIRLLNHASRLIDQIQDLYNSGSYIFYLK